MKRVLTLVGRAVACLAMIAVAVAPFTAVTYSTAFAAGISMTASVKIDFPNSITFSVNATGDANITSLRLHYVVDRQNFAPVVSEGWALFNPATSVSTEWVWDMRKSGLPVGAKISYWWTAADAAGKTAETSRASLEFADDRHTWQQITTAPVTLLWYNGNQSFANALMTAALQGLQRIETNTGAVPQGNVRIFIYASAQDLQSAQLFAQEWEGGVTFSGYDIIAIGVSTSQLSYGQRAVPHELTHWIVGQITFNEYGAGLPTWLDEGLATYGEGTLSPDYEAALQSAIANNQLISVRSLSSPFSAIAQQAYISYGESNSIVTFMISTYGKDKMRQLLEAFQKGAGYDEALQQVYGFDQDGLDKQWRQSLGIK
jgi:hypothetical protein